MDKKNNIIFDKIKINLNLFTRNLLKYVVKK